MTGFYVRDDATGKVSGPYPYREAYRRAAVGFCCRVVTENWTRPHTARCAGKQTTGPNQHTQPGPVANMKEYPA